MDSSGRSLQADAGYKAMIDVKRYYLQSERGHTLHSLPSKVLGLRMTLSFLRLSVFHTHIISEACDIGYPSIGS